MSKHIPYLLGLLLESALNWVHGRTSTTTNEEETICQ